MFVFQEIGWFPVHMARRDYLSVASGHSGPQGESVAPKTHWGLCSCLQLHGSPGKWRVVV